MRASQINGECSIRAQNRSSTFVPPTATAIPTLTVLHYGDPSRWPGVALCNLCSNLSRANVAVGVKSKNVDSEVKN